MQHRWTLTWQREQSRSLWKNGITPELEILEENMLINTFPSGHSPNKEMQGNCGVCQPALFGALNSRKPVFRRGKDKK